MHPLRPDAILSLNIQFETPAVNMHGQISPTYTLPDFAAEVLLRGRKSHMSRRLIGEDIREQTSVRYKGKKI